MQFFQLIFWLFVVGSAAAEPLSSIEDAVNKKGKITFTGYYHTSKALYSDVLAGHMVSKIDGRWALDEISGTALDLVWRSAILSRYLTQIKRSVLFLTMFQVPMAENSYSTEVKTDVYLVFSHSPGLEFHWDLNITNNNFQHVDTIQENATYYRDVYKVTTRYGGTFPIRLMVVNLSASLTYNMEWTMSLDLSSLQPLAPRLLRTIRPGVEFATIPALRAALQYGLPDTNLLDNVTLTASLPKSAIENQLVLDKAGEFVLQGYFKPSLTLNRFMLLSEEHLLAAICVPMPDPMISLPSSPCGPSKA